jgi:hypothetical protein
VLPDRSTPHISSNILHKVSKQQLPSFGATERMVCFSHHLPRYAMQKPKFARKDGLIAAIAICLSTVFMSTTDAGCIFNHASGGYSVSLLGEAYDFTTTGPNGAFGNFSGSEFTEVGQTIREFSATAGFRSSNGSLGVRASARAQGGWLYGPTARATTFASWQDCISLVWTRTGEIAPSLNGRKMNFAYNLEGTLESNWEVGHYAGTALRVEVMDTRHSFVISGNDFWDAKVVFPKVTGEVVLDARGQATWNAYIGVEVGSTRGSAIADFFNSMTLDAITFADGTTPESHGWELQFASGISSPNLMFTAVPEPSSFSIMAFAIGLCAVASRRIQNRQRKPRGNDGRSLC